MLPKQHRFELRRDTEFFHKARKIQTPYFRIFIQDVEDLSKLAVIVPKTKHLNAVKRNLLKRKVKAAALPIIKENKNLEIVIVVYQKTLEISVDQIRDILLKKILKK